MGVAARQPIDEGDKNFQRRWQLMYRTKKPHYYRAAGTFRRLWLMDGLSTVREIEHWFDKGHQHVPYSWTWLKPLSKGKELEPPKWVQEEKQKSMWWRRWGS